MVCVSCADMVRLVLFDIDGTLVRTGGTGIKAFARTFATIFGVHDGVEKIRFAGRTDVSLVREMFSLSQIPHTEENFRRFFDNYVHWLDHLMKDCDGDVCPGVMEFIRELEQLREPPLIGLLTGNVKLGAEIKLRHFKLWDVFKTGAFADDHEDRNQIAVVARERGSRALNRELPGSQILVIGDTQHDIRCARAIGAKVIAVATGGESLEELKKHQPDWAVKDLTEVSAAEVCA
ncbi:MAG: HAD family hydrolase [Verrucomicrobia bacterium]|nr:MAG: HAD family hydrolase [Verrucomicrobiota bacterium]